VEHLSHLLPAQGPIGVFIHHNTLHAFQHLPFEEAVLAASQTYGTEAYMTEDAFRQQLANGRIQNEDIDAVLNLEPNETIIPGRLDRKTLRRTLLLHGLRQVEPSTAQWYLEETDFLTAFRADLDSATKEHLIEGSQGSRAVKALFDLCLQLTERRIPGARIPMRPQQGLLEKTRIDLDEVVHPFLIRLVGAFLDQGVAYWPMPQRKKGFLRAVRSLLSQPVALFPEYLELLGEEMRRQAAADLNALDVVLEMLDRFGVSEKDWESVLQAELLALPGWAGIMHRLEQDPALAPYEQLRCSLIDFLAVRLTITAVAAAGVLRNTSERGAGLKSWNDPFSVNTASEAEHRAGAARLFDAVQLLGFSAAELDSLDSLPQRLLLDEMNSFGELERRRIFHLAYEWRHERLILDPLSRHRQLRPPAPFAQRPAAQVFFCLDEREESIRRHLEEVDPEVETLGSAGFYGIAVDYAGIDDAHGAAFCPVVLKPQHSVRERPLKEDRNLHETRRTRRRRWARVARSSFVGSRSLVRGWLSTAGLGLLSLFPLASRVLAPRQYARLRNALNRNYLPEPRTELPLLRCSEKRSTADGLLEGFSIEEKTDRVANMLRPAGLIEGFSRLVVVLGHGSTSLNNPHESAHDCGACGGRRGGANARMFAAMANHPEVRIGLSERGIRIPDDTWFIGGYHDTCNDEVALYDTGCIPLTHAGDFKRIRTSLDRARALNAQERGRRFEAVGPTPSPEQALRHVEARSEHLGEPRPEYGHATNAVCFVGRRAVTRGLFLDRRTFLISYNAAIDPDDDGLARLLGAALPVCAGINLEYYFSFVDNERYGCGTKLPHNVTGLIGVMNGHASDLRTGLPWQMVEIHEPVRILFVVESTPERVAQVIANNSGLSELVENRWIRLATLDPDTGEVHMRRGNTFERVDESTGTLPAAPTSGDWYRGRMEHLPMAQIGA
jgi:uncharacterized protein YbcC (UPF0753/DUF2309 family)